MLDAIFYSQCPKCKQGKFKWVDVIKGDSIYKGCSVYECQNLACRYKQTKDGNKVVKGD